MDFTLSRTKNRPPLTLRDSTITPTANHKFLGVILDQELRWKTHAAQAIAKGMKQALLLRRLSATSWGIPLKLMRQLYQSVVVPKVMYAASVWLQPTYTGDHSSKTRGSKGVRTAALAATGALKTTPIVTRNTPIALTCQQDSQNKCQVGAAAVMYVDHQHVATLRYHLGHESKHTVFEAEAAAMLLAAQLLRTRNETTYPVTILVDNQAVIRSSKN
ncbi:hypothetical protein M404DRAFT_809960 [Pisolithus tinctorius Marx 270]|uniref:RNase H type-1 domain-containing protein n=1 Tax=Pisolithus tinctorius Marx 270 TaxID=870435 RepID=A0A0C3N9H7_PISTI|nr:hypothetical protein M404DRAFT_809960 [Pisolithus tinctorius Marx 270]